MDKIYTYPVISMRLTGKWIQTISRLRGYRAKEIQESLGLTSVQSVYDWFHGKTLPTLENAGALAKLFECPVEDLLVERYGLPYGEKGRVGSYVDLVCSNVQKPVAREVREPVVYCWWVKPPMQSDEIKVQPE